MGSQAEYWTDIYAMTHEQRLAQSMDAARAELKERYALDKEYLQWLAEKQKLYEVELTKTQDALDQYSRARSGKPASSGDVAYLLGVIAKAGGDKASDTGRAAQRKLEAEAAVYSRYTPTAQQASAIGNVAAGIQAQNVAAVTSVADLNRIVRQQVNDKIAAGVVDTGSEQAKTMASELYSALDAALAANPVYVNNKAAVQAQMQADITAKLGVNPTYTDKQNVDADKKIDIAKAQKVVGVTGTGTSARAAKLAEDALQGKLGQATPEQQKAVAEWFATPQGMAYREALQRGANYEEAFRTATGALPEGALANIDQKDPAQTAGILFSTPQGDIRTLLATTGASFDIAKFFDPTYLDIYGRSQTLQKEIRDVFQERGEKMEALTVPTEEMARRRGTEIYEPVSPGVGARRREAAVREEEARIGDVQRARTGAGSVDDFLATRLSAPAIPEEQRVVSGAAAAAVRFGPKFQPEGEWDADSDAGWRMYRNVSEKMLRDTSPKGLVQHAADLAGGDPKKRDEILQSYYQWSLGEKQGLETRKREERVKSVETGPKPADLSGIKTEDIEL